MAVILGIDIGGTSIKAGLVSEGVILNSVEVPTMAAKGRKTVLNNIISAAFMAKGHSKISSIGVGCPGPIANGRILNTGNIPLAGFDLKNFLEREFKVPVRVEHDAHCFALGESLCGAGRGKKLVVGITIGTGLGTGIILNGELFKGRGNAGEFGHMIINPDGPKCTCGNKGCAEEYISARAIKRFSGHTPEELFSMAMRGSKKARKAFEKAGHYLGILVVNIIRAIDPDVIVIGGGISKARRFLRPSMARTIRQRLNYKPGTIVFSRLEDAGILGAAQQTF